MPMFWIVHFVALVGPAECLTSSNSPISVTNPARRRSYVRWQVALGDGSALEHGIEGVDVNVRLPRAHLHFLPGLAHGDCLATLNRLQGWIDQCHATVAVDTALRQHPIGVACFLASCPGCPMHGSMLCQGWHGIPRVDGH